MLDITVCIATFNRSHLLDGCIRSILDNNITAKQIHVVDNSTSEVHQHINSFVSQSYSVTYIKSFGSASLAVARNLSIIATTSEFWTFLDDDDRWPLGYLNSIARNIHTKSHNVILTYDNLFAQSDYSPYLITSLSSAFLMGLTPPVGMQVYNLKQLRSHLKYSSLIRTGIDHDLWVSLLDINPSLFINPLPFNILSVPATNRITQSYYSRKQNIMQSLTIWQPVLVRHLGTEFYVHFINSYNISLDDLLYSKILHGHINLLPYFSLFNFMRFLFRYITKKLHSSYPMFPPFTCSLLRLYP